MLSSPPTPRILLTFCAQLARFWWPQLGYAQSSVSFCDGDDLFTINEADCHGGINFGEAKPDCVCTSGIYRGWSEQCSLYDGFTSQYCFSVNNDKVQSLHGLRLLPQVSNVFTDTLAIFSENGTDPRSWTTHELKSNGKTWSDTFYTVNGLAFMLTKANDKFICVEPAVQGDKQVCRYFASDNAHLWEAGAAVRILLEEHCEVEGYNMSQLREHRCYPILNNSQSECQLDCRNGRTTYIPGSLQARAKKSVNATNDDDNNAEGESVAGSTSGLDLKAGGAAGPSSNANFFMHRKLNKYIRLRQAGQLSKPDLSQVAPNLTFTLLQTVNTIVKEWCPRQFISNLFLDQALELFVVLHQGQNYRYSEDMGYREFKLIQEILLNCRAEVNTNHDQFVRYGRWLQQNKDLDDCAKDDYVGFYRYIFQDIPITLPLQRGEHHAQGKYHFVIDAVWQMVNIVHARCLEEFSKVSYRMYHLWEQAFEALFTREIRSLWFNPQVGIGIYNELLSNRALVDMVSLDRCAEAAYMLTTMPELTRPEPKKSIYKRRKRETFGRERNSVAKSVDVYCARNARDAIYNC